MANSWTYNDKAQARYGETILTIPDQVSMNLKAWVKNGNQAFSALRGDGRCVHVRLDWPAFGLFTDKPGETIVFAA